MTTKSVLPKAQSTFFKRLQGSQSNSQTIILLGVFVILFVFFGVVKHNFFGTASINSMAFQLPEIGILSLAMLLPTIAGGIDLSVNSVANLAAVLSGIFMVKILPPGLVSPTVSIILAIGLALLIGAICGLLNGFLIAYVNVPPILATLATYTFVLGLATGVTGGASVTGLPEELGTLGAGTFLSIPYTFVIFAVLTVFVYFLLFRTTYGFRVRMLGSNPTAAKFSGLRNKSILTRLYMISGILSAIAGIVVVSYTMSANYEYGTTTYVLMAILITVLSNITPGFGSVLNIFISVLILQVISTGSHMALMEVQGSSFFKDFLWGILMILIFILNYFMHPKSSNE